MPDSIEPNRLEQILVVFLRDHMAVEIEEKFEDLRKRCESPIEECMLLVFLCSQYELRGPCDPPPYEVQFSDYDFPYERPHPFESSEVYIQANILDFRVDFLVDFWSEDSGRHLIVVECDGHDFHDRTKEQAARDRARDRLMLSNGIKVVRFTGSEIWKDPFGCIFEIDTIIARLEP